MRLFDGYMVKLLFIKKWKVVNQQFSNQTI